ncbi:hypothetical protein HGA64_03110 [Candidatus Falkowbacteria bacterium]|nr:hypothetical protein [Candidatus Falkowbacteria bacterium]
MVQSSKQPTKIGKVLKNPHTIFITLVILLFAISFPLADNITKRHKVGSEISVLQEEIKANEQKQTDLQKLIGYLDSKEFAEEQARLSLDLKKPGENVVVVRNNSKKVDDPERSVTNLLSKPEIKPEVDDVSNPVRWWRYFFVN